MTRTNLAMIRKRNSESDTEEEEENRRVDIEYATKNKESKKKRGKRRKDSLIVKTITITERKSKRYQCTQKACTEVFEDVKEWIKHIENEHKLEEYSCNTCGHKTKSKQKYDQHMMKHDEKKNKWKCTVCAKTFTHRCYLMRHELNHTNEKNINAQTLSVRKRNLANSNARQILFTIWRNILENGLCVQYVGQIGH